MAKDEINIEPAEYPSLQYKKFFEKFLEIDNLEVAKWNITHLIAYFARRYKQHYNVDFTFKFNSPSPSKCYEVYNMNKLSHMISKDPIIIKNYIDWWFDKKIILKKKRIISMAFLTDANICNEFKWQIMQSTNIDRTTTIPQKYLDAIQSFNTDIKTYGDLAFIRNSTNDTYKTILQTIVNLGFDISILGKVK